MSFYSISRYFREHPHWPMPIQDQPLRREWNYNHAFTKNYGDGGWKHPLI